MKKSKNKEVQKFLGDIKSVDAEKFRILEELRDIVLTQYPEGK